jgi:hypothetical protein
MDSSSNISSNISGRMDAFNNFVNQYFSSSATHESRNDGKVEVYTDKTNNHQIFIDHERKQVHRAQRTIAHTWITEKTKAAFNRENYMLTILDPTNPKIIPPKPMTCCLCRRCFIGYGNNANPVMDDRCCDECDLAVVRTARCAEIVSQGKIPVPSYFNEEKRPEISKNTPTAMTIEELKQQQMMSQIYKKIERLDKWAERQEEKQKAIDFQLKKIRKEAERKAKEEAEEKARKEAREQRKRERKEEAFKTASAGVSIAELTAVRPKEDDEAKEIRARAEKALGKTKRNR